VPIPDALKLKPLPPVPLPEALDLDRLLREDRAKASLPDPSLETRLSVRPPGEPPEGRAPAGPPKLEMPKAVPPPDTLAQRPADPGEVLEDVLQTARRPDASKDTGERRDPATPAQERARVEEELARLLPQLERQEAPAPIRGPAASRRIIFQPPPPQVVDGLEGSADIVLRFWVLPDGTVGRVIPIRKGSARLEGIAAAHLKRWRFSPLPPHAAPREEWGIVAFRFRMR
jgi:hypothetical protein